MELATMAVCAVIAFGAFVQGLSGFGLALVSVPLLSLVIDVKLAVPIAGIFGWFVTFPTVWKMHHHVQWKTALILFAGSLPGSFVGADLLKRLPSEVILIAMGVVLLASSIYALRAKESLFRKTSSPVTALTGFLSGALGASVGEPGPPVIAYTSMQPWSADQAKSTLSLFFMLTMVGAIAGFMHQGLLTSEVWDGVTIAAPGFLIGMCLGMACYSRLHMLKIDYHQFIHGFLTVIASLLILKNVSV